MKELFQGLTPTQAKALSDCFHSLVGFGTVSVLIVCMTFAFTVWVLRYPHHQETEAKDGSL